MQRTVEEKGGSGQTSSSAAAAAAASLTPKSDSTYVTQLRKEIAQLRHTLDIRRAEILLAERRTAELMDRCASIRDASLETSRKVVLVRDLEEELQAARQEEAILKKELRNVQKVAEREEQLRQAEQLQHLGFYNALLAQADSIAAFCLKKQKEVKEKPIRAVGSLLNIGADVVEELTSAIDAFQAAEAAAERQAARLHDVHNSCLSEIALAAERNEQQRVALEESWQKEEMRLQKELLDVRNRAQEAEFHRQRSPHRREQQQNPSSSEVGFSGGHRSSSSGLGTTSGRLGGVGANSSHFDVKERQILTAEVLDLEQRISRVLKQRASERKNTSTS